MRIIGKLVKLNLRVGIKYLWYIQKYFNVTFDYFDEREINFFAIENYSAFLGQNILNSVGIIWNFLCFFNFVIIVQQLNSLNWNLNKSSNISFTVYMIVAKEFPPVNKSRLKHQYSYEWLQNY